MREATETLRALERLKLMEYHYTNSDEFDVDHETIASIVHVIRTLEDRPTLARLIWPGDSPRPSFEQWLAEMAWLASSRSTCPRARVGAVIYRDNRLLSTGYNGAPPGATHCDSVGCIMEATTYESSTPDEDPVIEYHCRRSNHAEVNALAHAARFGIPVVGASLITTHSCCRLCRGALNSAGIVNIIELTPYGKGTLMG